MKRPPLATVCAWCGRVRTPQGGWSHEDEAPPPPANTTHAICRECLERALHHAAVSTWTEAG